MSRLEGVVCERTLKSQIFRVINSSKLQEGPHFFINNTVKKQTGHRSKAREEKSGLSSPNLKTQVSSHKTSKHPTEKSGQKRGMMKENSSGKDSLIKHAIKQQPSTANKQKHHKSINLIETKSQKHADYVLGGKSSTFDLKKQTKKQNGGRQKSSSSARKDKARFVSQLEHSSPEEIIATPEKKKEIRKNLSSIESQTSKKMGNQLLPQSLKRKIGKNFTEPEKFQSLMKCDLLRVSYRILKRKLIEIEIYILKDIEELRVTLEKGNLQCQNIQQQYTKLPPNTVLSLLSSVRKFNTDNLLDFPKVLLELSLGESRLQIQKQLTIPFTWLHLIQESKKAIKKGSIRTKICLSNILMNINNFKIISEAMLFKLKKMQQDKYQYECRFALQEQEFVFKIIEHSKYLDLEIEGRGEQRLTKMIQFFSSLLA